MSQKTSAKNTKRLTQFNDNWLNNSEFNKWLSKSSDYMAKCNICNSEFTVKYSGQSALIQHKEGTKHKSMEQTIKMSQTMRAFVTQSAPKIVIK